MDQELEYLKKLSLYFKTCKKKEHQLTTDDLIVFAKDIDNVVQSLEGQDIEKPVFIPDNKNEQDGKFPPYNPKANKMTREEFLSIVSKSIDRNDEINFQGGFDKTKKKVLVEPSTPREFYPEENIVRDDEEIERVTLYSMWLKIPKVLRVIIVILFGAIIISLTTDYNIPIISKTFNSTGG